MSLYSEKIEALIDAALADGVLTEKEKQILFKKAQAEGIDLDEFEMVLDARLVELQKEKNANEAHSAPKSDKFGDVRKCPACGALVPALAGVCPECGYEFSGVTASSSSQKLAKGIAEIKKDAADKKNEIIKSGKYSTKKQKMAIFSPQEEALNSITSDEYSQIHSLVNSFPVPNTKNDLFDLIMYLKTQGYKNKYQECMDRAKMLFPNDPLFAQIINTTKAEKTKEIKEETSVALAVIAGIIAAGLVIYLEWHFLQIGWGWKLLIALLCQWVGVAVGFFVKKALNK